MIFKIVGRFVNFGFVLEIYAIREIWEINYLVGLNFLYSDQLRFLRYLKDLENNVYLKYLEDYDFFKFLRYVRFLGCLKIWKIL